ncbi:MAG: 3-isopropylmalate dehydratase small subunit [Patescibacteria group bacterium]|nr:3-isopropylmalate dehydratase small subunit [Patescibacteria group bacterium]
MKHRKLTVFTSTAVPLPDENIDTDQIIPARFLKATTREGFGENLFRDWRYNPDGTPKTEFVLNNPRYSGEILVVGKNFGCGSSREHAAWALVDYGFKAVVSSFFADIFKGNALNNSLLPIVVPEAFLQKLLTMVQEHPETKITVDLPKQTVSVEGTDLIHGFDINPYKKACLINGYDDIDYLMSLAGDIAAFEKARKQKFL